MGFFRWHPILYWIGGVLVAAFGVFMYFEDVQDEAGKAEFKTAYCAAYHPSVEVVTRALTLFVRAGRRNVVHGKRLYLSRHRACRKPAERT